MLESFNLSLIIPYCVNFSASDSFYFVKCFNNQEKGFLSNKLEDLDECAGLILFI